MSKRTLILIAVAGLSVACKGNIDLGGDEPALLDSNAPAQTDPEATSSDPTLTDPETSTPEVANEEPEIVYEIPDFTAEQLITYMRTISQLLVSRPLSAQEAQQIEADGVDALEPILRAWSTQPEFAENARFMMQQKLKASGARDGIDFELPGNLVRHVVANDLPWSTILTADYCVDAAGNEIECDTGAPYAAGVLATRAFMAGNASRFNLGRANVLMEVFACRIYPMEQTLQPYLERETLIPMFQADTQEEQQVEEAKNGFGNGDGCYSCHGQFGAHAQLFVKFAEDGTYVPDADGQQDPSGELGRSVNGLMTSHMIDPVAAADEGSQVFGANVANLAEAASVIAQSDAFLPCQTGKIIHHAFGLPESVGIDRHMLNDIAARARELHEDPTYTDLAVTAFTHPRVILSAVGDEAGGDP